MTFADEIHRFESGLVQRMRASFDQARAAAGQRRVYQQTLDELGRLTERDLEDLGIHRDNIRDIARDAAYGGK